MTTSDDNRDLTTNTDRLLRITPLVEPVGLRIEGELDRVTLPALLPALAAMSGRGSFSVDVSGLVFCDVGGLRTLVTAAAGLCGGHILTMRSPSPEIRRLLKLTGWHKMTGLRLQAASRTLPNPLGSSFNVQTLVVHDDLEGDGGKLASGTGKLLPSSGGTAVRHRDDGRSILVGYDESSGSEQALRWAAEEARLRDCPVLVCHAWQWPYPLRPAGEQMLAQVEHIATAVVHNGVVHVREHHAGIEVRPLLTKGPVSAVLLKAAEEAQLVVLGSRGVGGFEDLRVGSAAVQVPAHSARPVVVVRPAAEPIDRPTSRIIVGVDGSPASKAAFGFALREAALRGGTVTAICAWWDPGALPGPDQLPFVDAAMMRAGAETRFRQVVSLLTAQYPDVPVTTDFVGERPPRAIVEAARGATLLVLGRSGLGPGTGTPLGAVTQAALSGVHCPVAVTPPPD